MTQLSKRTTPAPRGIQKHERGYTIIELMMALAIFSVGITGIMAMQSIAASSNRFAKNMATATELARSWQDKLAMDSTLWGGAAGWPPGNTRWLNVIPGAVPTWILPADDAGGSFGPAAGSKGEYVVRTSADVLFCTHIRLTTLIGGVNRENSGLLRSEVRVFWPKNTRAWNGGANYCDPAASIAAIGAATSDFHFVYKTTAIRQTPNF